MNPQLNLLWYEAGFRNRKKWKIGWAERQRRIEQRYQELKQEVESLRELRQIAGKVQADVAAALKIKQPSVSKIEQQADMYLSTLRSYVEAIGGDLELVVNARCCAFVRLVMPWDRRFAPVSGAGAHAAA